MDENEVLDDSSTAAESTETRDIIEQQLTKLEETQESVAEAQTETQPEPEEKPEQPKHDPWRSWKKEAAEEMSKLPENVQKHIIERQDQFHKGLEQYKEAANYAKSIDKAISPYKEYLGQLGVSPEVAFPNLLKTERTLRIGSPAEKVEMFQKLAHDYGIDLRALADVPFDPQLAQYKQQLEWTQNQLQASQDFRQSHEDAQILGSIEEFGARHEFFDDVRNDMADLLEKGLAQSLDEAYAKAVRMNEAVFNKSMARTNLNNADQAAKAAKAAAVSVKGSPVGVKNQSAPKTTEDAVRWAMAQHGL
jgi:hypothetical protein